MRGRRILWVILVLVALSVIWVAAQQIAFSMRPKVALVRLSGAISESLDTGFFGEGGITPAQVEGFLKRAERDPSVKALVLRVDSPGGTVAASQAIAENIKGFKEKTKKPVIVSMGDVAASGDTISRSSLIRSSLIRGRQQVASGSSHCSSPSKIC